jgi:hypothetical protein
MKISVKMTCEQMPNQFEGHINGVPFYYRARHGNHELVLRPFTEQESIVFSGKSKNAGWWEPKTAKRRLMRVIYKCCKNRIIV